MAIKRRETPGAERSSRLFIAYLSNERLPRHQVVIRNVSIEGVGVRSKHEAPFVGEMVHLDLANQDVREGVVRWVDGEKMGIELSTPLNPEDYHFEDKDWRESWLRLDQQRRGLAPNH